jgi:hypothetical protein
MVSGEGGGEVPLGFEVFHDVQEALVHLGPVGITPLYGIQKGEGVIEPHSRHVVCVCEDKKVVPEWGLL